jgi:hypothetical protein
LFNNFTTNEDIAQQPGAHCRHIPLHFSPTNVLLFKSRRNIFIGFGIIKELPGLVGGETSCMCTNKAHPEHILFISAMITSSQVLLIQLPIFIVPRDVIIRKSTNKFNEFLVFVQQQKKPCRSAVCGNLSFHTGL